MRIVLGFILGFVCFSPAAAIARRYAGEAWHAATAEAPAPTQAFASDSVEIDGVRYAIVRGADGSVAAARIAETPSLAR